MLSVALTGNIASGKSTVANILATLGATVIDADRLVHELQRSGTPVFHAIVRRFGPEVVGPDGELDRATLRKRVLEDEAARLDLEAIVHPAVANRRAELVAEARNSGAPVVVSDIPLLFEINAQDAFDGVILVDAPVDERRRRLLEGRQLQPAEVERLLTVQQSAAAKRSRSTWVIENDAGRDVLEARTRAVWQDLLRRARA